MEPVWMLFGLVAGIAAAFVVARGRLRELMAVLEVARSERDDARAEAEAIRAERDGHAERCTTLTEEKLTEVGALSAQLAGLRAELHGAQTQVKTLTEAREDLLAQVGEKVAAVFTDSGKALVDLAKSEMKTVTTEARADFEKRGKEVTDLVAPVKQTMTEMQDAMSKLDRERTRTFARLSQQLTSVTDGQRDLRLETGALARALRQPHTRGKWGEYHLRRAAEMAGMTAYCDFVEQARLDDEGTVLRPDMVVRIPGDRRVPVDAKAPLAPYLDACEAEDDKRPAHMALYARGLRAHVKKLADKRYFEQLNSPEFVVMYLPGEQYLGAALEVDGTVLDDAFRQRVIIATPTTLIALLWSVACGWQQTTVANEARAIAELGRELYNRLGVLLGHVDLVSKRLNSAVDAQNKVVGSLQRRVLPTARRFPELGIIDANSELDITRSVQLQANCINAPGFDSGDQDRTVSNEDATGVIVDDDEHREEAA